MWLFLLLSSWIFFSQWRAGLFRWGHRLRKKKKRFSLQHWFCGTAQWQYHSVTKIYHTLNRAVWSWLVKCFSGLISQIECGTGPAKAPEIPRLHNLPHSFYEVPEWMWEKTQKNGTLTKTPLQWGLDRLLPLLEAYLSLSPSNLYLYTSLSEMRNGVLTPSSIIYLNSMSQNLHFN